MRPIFLLPVAVLALLLLATPPALARQRVDGVVATSAADTVVAEADAEGAATAGHGDANGNAEDAETHAGSATDAAAPRSGFGQVMSVLTGLLQDAARRETTGRGDGFALDNPAIEISVTPVAGQTSLLRSGARDRSVRRTPRATGGARQLAGGTPR